MRALATVRHIDEILPIEGADAIVLVKIDGWQLIALKDEFKVGDNCVYFEIDSWIPLIPQVEHIRVRAYKKMGDKEGVRIKTIKLRGQISQGLALPLKNFPKVFDVYHSTRLYNPNELFFDVTELLGVEKYQLPLPPQLEGKVSGNFPSFIPKTDQERAQNLVKQIFDFSIDNQYEITIKLDGCSFTAFHHNGEDGVCSRNWKLENVGGSTNSLVRMYVDSGLGAVMHDLGLNLALQAELCGPGIEKNRENLKAHKLFIFDIYDIDDMRYYTTDERLKFIKLLYEKGVNSNLVTEIPLIVSNVKLAELGITNIQELLAFSDGPSLNHAIREGLVYKKIDGTFSFKVISNLFLLKSED